MDLARVRQPFAHEARGGLTRRDAGPGKRHFGAQCLVACGEQAGYGGGPGVQRVVDATDARRTVGARRTHKPGRRQAEVPRADHPQVVERQHDRNAEFATDAQAASA